MDPHGRAMDGANTALVASEDTAPAQPPLARDRLFELPGHALLRGEPAPARATEASRALEGLEEACGERGRWL